MSNKNKEIVMPTWRDKQTPVNAANLNSMVQSIKQNSNDIKILSQAMSLLNDSKLDKVELQDNILKFYAKEVVKFSISIPTGSGEIGIPGQDGRDGREIELRKGETHIEWNYVGEDNWKHLVSLEDLKGQDGVTPNITIGEVTTLEPGQQATVTIRGTTEAPIFDFGIPQGQHGGGEGGSVDLSAYQTKNDSTLNTEDKTVVGAINEIASDTSQNKTDLDNHLKNHPSGEIDETILENKITQMIATQYKANPVEPLNIKTYAEGQNQPTHPSVKFFSEGWNGHKYWMAYTPYPGNANMHENPCITYSEDGINWREDGINNPIAPKPTQSGAYNSDVHLVFANNILECWWREVVNNVEIIVRKKSSNGTTWGEREELYRTPTNTADCCLSPSIIFDEGKYKIWVVYKRQCLKYYESTDGTNWIYIRDINVSTTDGVFKVWHFDIIKNNDIYEFVGCYQYNGQFDKNNFIYYAKSKDNITYSTPIKILGNGDEGQFDDLELYRPCLCIDDKGNYRMYYGAQKNIRIWHIGLVTCRNIEALNNLLVNQNAVIDRLQANINDLYKLIESGGNSGGQTTPVSEVRLNKNSATLKVGQTLQLVETVLPELVTNKTVAWESNNNDIATVSATGLVTAKKEGSCAIKCISNSNSEKYATCNLNISSSDSTPFLNLFDYSQSLDGGYYHAETGVWTTNVKWSCSPKIEIDSNIEISFGGNSCAFFDSEDRFISGITYSDTFDRVGSTPSNVNSVSFAFGKTDKKKSYLYKLPLLESEIPIGTNLYNPENANKTGYYDADSGEFVESTQYYSSDFIKVDAGIKIQQTGGNTIAGWNFNKKIIGVINNNSIIPKGVDYITVSVSSSSYQSMTIKRTE